MNRLIVLLVLGASVAVFRKVDPIPNPTRAGSLQPNWSVTPEGDPLLSWIEPIDNDTFALRYAVFEKRTWSEPHTVVANRHFFQHPAEAPAVMILEPGHWMAHWVENPDRTNDAEFIYVSSSTDGIHWTAPAMAHHDRSPVEHGLASMIGTGNGEASLIWLEAPKGDNGPAYLMRTIINSTGQEVAEETLDSDVCACCPTAVAKTSKGLLVAYRDHAPYDIRDISVIRFESGHWSQPQSVNEDNWILTACPVNAASVAAQGDHVVVAWFTSSHTAPRVLLVFSKDGGATFGEPILISTSRAYGYTSVVLNASGDAVVSWLEANEYGPADLMIRTITPGGKRGSAARVVNGEKSSLGYPRLVNSAAGTFIAWGGDKIQTALVEVPAGTATQPSP